MYNVHNVYYTYKKRWLLNKTVCSLIKIFFQLLFLLNFRLTRRKQDRAPFS